MVTHPLPVTRSPIYLDTRPCHEPLLPNTQSEIFPMNQRAYGTAVSTASNWVSSDRYIGREDNRLIQDASVAAQQRHHRTNHSHVSCNTSDTAALYVTLRLTRFLSLVVSTSWAGNTF